jgi:DNA-binding NarL/FixJ family response regulator
MEKKIKIHLADDHPVVIDGIKTLLQTITNFEVVGHSIVGTNIFEDVKTDKSDVLILDLSMPQKDGFEVLKEFKAKGSSCKVIILSSYDDLKIIKEVMKHGASAYLTKQCGAENIIEAIYAVNNGEEYYCNTVREKIFSTATKAISKLNKNKPSADSLLSDREIEIITLIALEFSGKEISEQLFISINTVETHRKNILKKLNAKNTISLVKYAIKYNLIKS